MCRKSLCPNYNYLVDWNSIWLEVFSSIKVFWTLRFCSFSSWKFLGMSPNMTVLSTVWFKAALARFCDCVFWLQNQLQEAEFGLMVLVWRAVVKSKLPHFKLLITWFPISEYCLCLFLARSHKKISVCFSVNHFTKHMNHKIIWVGRDL